MDAVSAMGQNAMNVASKTEFGVPRKAQQMLGSDDFIQLLTVQLSHQDPLNPMQDTDFIAQMSNFTSLEQVQDLATTFSKFSENQQLASAQNYLGREVTYSGPDGRLHSGLATAMRTVEGEDGGRQALLKVGDAEIPVSAVSEVKLAE